MTDSDTIASSMPSGAAPDDARLLAVLRGGDEAAFAELVACHQGAMLRVALIYTGDAEAAADVVQEAWLGVLRGLARFEGRSSLKTWIFRILTNCAKTRAQREGRTIPFSDLAGPEDGLDEPAVEPDRFQGANGRYPGGWVTFPASWQSVPDDVWLARETRLVIDGAIAALPPNQREVVTLRDIEGWSSDEVCNVLRIAETDQRVLLHRGRAKVRRALEQYLNLDREGRAA